LFKSRTKNNTNNNDSNELFPNHFQTSLLHNNSFFRFYNKKYFSDFADKYFQPFLFFQKEQKHSTLTLSNNLIVLLTFYIFLNSLHCIERNFYELLTTFEISYFKSRCSHHPNYVLYLGKFMGVFDILQKLANKFFKICWFSNVICHFPVFIMKFLRSEKSFSWRMKIILHL
jgi:hypothetical protein